MMQRPPKKSNSANDGRVIPADFKQGMQPLNKSKELPNDDLKEKAENIPFLDVILEKTKGSVLIKHKTDWYRKHDFYKTRQQPSFVYLLTVFRNNKVTDCVKEIKICRDREDNVFATLSFSPFKREEILLNLKALFDDGEYKVVVGDTVEIKLGSVEGIKKMYNFFDKLNVLNENEIPGIILHELAQICYSIHNANKKYHHYLSELKLIDSYVNPARKNSKALVKLIHQLLNKLLDVGLPASQPLPQPLVQETKRIMLCSAKKMLVKGEDPNQEDDAGMSPLCRAVIFDVELVSALLIYGANPFRRPSDLHFSSPFEMAKEYNRIEILDCIIVFCSPPQKSLKIDDSAFVQSLDIRSDEKQVLTRMQRKDNKKMDIHFMSCAEFFAADNKQEKDSVLRLFEDYFECVEPNNNSSLSKLFIEDCKGENKYIQLVYFNNQLIGFNLFEIMMFKEANDPVILHCIYALLNPSFCGSGLMSFLTFRLAFSLQQLMLNKKVGIFLSVINDNCYRMVKNTLHFPKYKSDHMPILINKIVHQIYGPDVKYTDNDAACSYIKEDVPIRVKTTMHTKARADSISTFFYKDILDQKQDVAAPVFYYVDNNSAQQLQELLSTIGIDFINHICKFAANLKPFVQNVTGNTSYQGRSVYFVNKDIVFWGNQPDEAKEQKAAIKEAIKETKPLLRSKL